MSKYSIFDFRQNIVNKKRQARQTKGQRAEQLYGNLTFDVAVPVEWERYAAEQLGTSRKQISSNFVWLYPDGNIVGQPAPLTLVGCDMLLNLSNIEEGLVELERKGDQIEKGDPIAEHVLDIEIHPNKYIIKSANDTGIAVLERLVELLERNEIHVQRDVNASDGQTMKIIVAVSLPEVG